MVTPTVLLLDALPLFRDGIRKILLESHYQITGEVSSLKAAMDALKETRPNAIIIGSLFNQTDWPSLLNLICSTYPTLQVILIIAPYPEPKIDELVQNGAEGILCSTSSRETYQFAFNQVIMRNDLFIDSSFSAQLFDSFTHLHPPPLHDPSSLNVLSHRESEIFSLLISGLSVKEIAIQLSRSPKTIDNHKTKIMKKLGVCSYYELLQFAQKTSLTGYL